MVPIPTQSTVLSCFFLSSLRSTEFHAFDLHLFNTVSGLVCPVSLRVWLLYCSAVLCPLVSGLVCPVSLRVWLLYCNAVLCSLLSGSPFSLSPATWEL